MKFLEGLALACLLLALLTVAIGAIIIIGMGLGL